MDNPLEIRSALGRYAIAMAMVAFGVQHLVYGDFVTRMVPRLPAWIPGHAALAYGFGAFLIVAGGALMPRTTAHLAALVLGGTLLASFSFLYLPMVLSDLRNAGLWTNAGKALALSGGAFLVAGNSPQKSRDLCRWPANLGIPLERLIPFGRYFLSLFLAFCGILHFIYVPFVAGLVPAWIPGHVFWTYFSGIALVAGGVGMALPRTVRLAAALSSLMVFLWVVLLHIPRAAANLRNSNETTAVFEAIAVAGSALLVATSHGQTALHRGGKRVRTTGAPVIAANNSQASKERKPTVRIAEQL